jgi:undecaprenyl diphosphate synthase
MSLKDSIDPHLLPVHVAIIMDGNGRWAKQRGGIRIFGHQNAVKSVRDAVEASVELDIRYLTLYTFSKENWNRPKQEVTALMSLLVSTIQSEIESLSKNGVRLQVIGDTDQLPPKVKRSLLDCIENTKNNTKLTLVLALSYSSRWEIVTAVKNIAADVKQDKFNENDIDEKLFQQYLNTASIPDPELLIRTSGEIRISNFLLYQLAYTELYFTDTLWPDFSKEEFYKAIVEYQKRERRFGLTSEQIKGTKKK